jgi:hypothetical protein
MVIVKFQSHGQIGDCRWLSKEQPLLGEVRVHRQAHLERVDETAWLELTSQDSERIQEDFLVSNVVDDDLCF